MRLSNVILRVSDLGESVAFWRDLVGLDLSWSGDEFAFFAVGDHQLTLNQPLVFEDQASDTEIVFEVDEVHSAISTHARTGCPLRGRAEGSDLRRGANPVRRSFPRPGWSRRQCHRLGRDGVARQAGRRRCSSITRRRAPPGWRPPTSYQRRQPAAVVVSAGSVVSRHRRVGRVGVVCCHRQQLPTPALIAAAIALRLAQSPVHMSSIQGTRVARPAGRPRDKQASYPLGPSPKPSFSCSCRPQFAVYAPSTR